MMMILILAAATAIVSPDAPKPYEVTAAKELGAETGRSDIDGYRIEYAEGWVSVRQSNTEPLLRLLVECDTPARLASWRATLVAALQS